MDDKELNQANFSAICSALLAVVSALRKTNAIDEQELKRNMLAAINASKVSNRHQAVDMLELLLKGFQMGDMYHTGDRPHLQVVPTEGHETDD